MTWPGICSSSTHRWTHWRCHPLFSRIVLDRVYLWWWMMHNIPIRIHHRSTTICRCRFGGTTHICGHECWYIGHPRRVMMILIVMCTRITIITTIGRNDNRLGNPCFRGGIRDTPLIGGTFKKGPNIGTLQYR